MARRLRPMKKLALFYMFLLLALWSCASPYVFKGKLDSYNVEVPDKFPFYKEPSLKKGPFYLEKPEEFVVEALYCSEDDIFCGYLPSFNYAERLFFKVRFKSGETAYIRYNDRNTKSAYITRVYGPSYDPQYYDNVDLDPVWNAAMEALHELYFVIRFMSKEDGYISAEQTGSTTTTVLAGIRIFKKDALVTVSINLSARTLNKKLDYSVKPNIYVYSLGPDSGYDIPWHTKLLHEKMSSKLSKYLKKDDRTEDKASKGALPVTP